mgnify:CR=1 FL=1
MGEKKKPNASLPIDLLDLVSSEMTRYKPKLFSKGTTIFILEDGLTMATVLSKNGFTAQRLKNNLEKLHQYVLVDEEASINIDKYDAGGKMLITRGFPFWGY